MAQNEGASERNAADRLARACEEVLDPPMRVAFVRHSLAALPEDDAADVLAVAARSAGLGDPRARQLFSTAAMALAPSVATSLREALAHAAYRRGHHDLARMLVRETLPPTQKDQAPDHGQGRPLTLGERKSLARRRDRLLLTRILADPHPDVIRMLLANPMIVEADVVRLAARRPLPAEVFREIAGTPRWMIRYAVQLTLVKNPHAPRDVSLPLVLALRRPDLVELASLPDVSEAMRQAARRGLSPPVFA